MRKLGKPEKIYLNNPNQIMAISRYGRFLGTHHRKTSFMFDAGAKAREEGKAILGKVINEGRKALLEHEAKELLRLHGAPAGPDRLAETAEEAIQIAGEMGGQVALKIASPDILHKSDAGGVRLGLEGKDEIRSAFHDILESARAYNRKADIRGCVVSPMVGRGTELIIGTKIDEQFGPVIMFGIGGIMVEVVKDVSFRVLPLSKMASRKMIGEIKLAPILNGVRGQQPSDKKAISRLLLTVSEIIEAYPQIQEMDLNPVIAHEDKITIVDARIILNPSNNNHERRR